MKFVLQIHIDPKTGKPIPIPWIGEGEPPPLVEPAMKPEEGKDRGSQDKKRPS